MCKIYDILLKRLTFDKFDKYCDKHKAIKQHFLNWVYCFFITKFVIYDLKEVIKNVDQCTVRKPQENRKLLVLGIILLLGFYFFEYTILGKQCKAIGAAEKSAIFSGVNVKKIKIIAFAIAGLLAGLCGMLTLIRTRIASPFTGNLFEIEVFMALVFGGMPINGGMKSKIRCGFFGSLMLGFITNGLVIMGVSASVLQLIKGFVFLGAVYISMERRALVVIK